MNSEVKGIILAAGKGTRLSEISDGVPKLLLRIAGKSLVEHLARQLLDAGINDLVVVTREGTTEAFKQVFEKDIELAFKHVSFVEVPVSNNNVLETMFSIRNHVNSGKLVYSCDVLLKGSLRPAVCAFKGQKDGARTVSSYMNDTAGFSHLSVDDDKIIKFHKKIKDSHRSGLIDLGFWMFHTDVFLAMEKLLSLDESMGILELNKYYVDLGLHHHTEVKGWWSDVGNSCDEFNKTREFYSE